MIQTQKTLKRPILWSLFLCLVFSGSCAQQFDWATSVGALGLDVARDVAVDPQGNFVVIGDFSGTTSIAGTPLSGFGGAEAFVAKFNPQGSLQWAKVISGPAEDRARGLMIDDDGNIYVVGHFTDTVVFHQTENELISSGSLGQKDIFVVKYSPTGEVIWQFTGGSRFDDTATGIDWNRWTNKLYISGGFQSRGDFGNGIALSNGDSDAFLLKMDVDGNTFWAKSGGGEGHEVAADVVVDVSSQSVYITGDFYQNATFENTQLEAVGSSDMFLAKYSEEGEMLWIKSNGGTNVDVATKLGIDLNQKVYVSGYYQLTTVFEMHTATALGYNDVFLAQFNPEGDCMWLKSAGSNALDNALGLAVDWDGTTYQVGMFEEEIYADDLSVEGDDYDIFIIARKPTGEVKYIKTAGAGSSDFGMAAALGPNNELYITGYYFFFADFDEITIGNAENGDAFVARLTDVVGIESIRKNQSDCININSESSTVSVTCPIHGNYHVFNALGQLEYSGKLTSRFTLPELKKGVHFLQVQTSEGAISLPFIE